MIYVFDSSFVCALIIPDEKNSHTDRLYAKIKNEEEKYAPQIIWYEIANIFKNLLRRRRCTYNEILQLFPSLNAIRFTTDSETGIDYSQKLLRLCNEYNISSYDAAYLELAARKKAVLCTLDDGLKIAAKKHGVAIIK